MKRMIRQIELSDADAVRDIYKPFVSGSATSFETSPPDTEEIERRIQDLREWFPWLVFEADGRVLGYAYASSHRARQAYQWCVEVSVYIDKAARRSGVGRALYLSLFELLRRQGYVNAYAGITLPNPASIGLHQHLGFSDVGVYSRIGFKLGQWHDVAWLQLRLQECKEPVTKPHLVKDVLDSSAENALDRWAKTVRSASLP